MSIINRKENNKVSNKILKRKPQFLFNNTKVLSLYKTALECIVSSQESWTSFFKERNSTYMLT